MDQGLAVPQTLLPLIPLYKCHKLVRALRIKNVEEDMSSPHWVAIELENFPQLEGLLVVNCENRPRPKPGWYYVVYMGSEEYESFSPPEAFEAGYSLVVSGGQAP